MTSFLICHPDVPKDAMVISSSAAFATDYSVMSTVYGERHAYGQLSATGTSVSITYDLGTGNSRTVDHFILGGAQVLKSNGVTQATLQGSNDGSSWTNQLGTASGFQTRTFNGPDGDDVIFTAAYNDEYAATLAAYRYFRVTLAGGSAHKFPVSKIFFGSAFDMGQEPDFYELDIIEENADTWTYPRGQVAMNKSTAAKHRFTVEWDGVSDAKAEEFFEKVLANPLRNHVFLYTTSYHDPLYDNRLAYCRVASDRCSVTKSNEKTNWHDVVAVFEEV